MNRLIKTPARKQNQVFILMAGLFMFLAALSVTGCDNNDSYEAKLEDARIALDDGNYDRAKSILETLPQTIKVLEYMSNAIAGGALNLDTLNIISTLDELDNEGSVGSIDMIGRVIGGENNQLDCADIATKLQAATEAIEQFKLIAELTGVEMNALTDNQKTQLGLLGITRVVLTLAHRICARVDGPVIMTEAWIRENRAGFTPLVTADQEGTVEVNTDLAMINEDLVYIGYAIDALADSNDLKDDFQEFKAELDADQSGDVTVAELNTYISDL